MAFSDSTWQVHLPQWTQLFSFLHVGTKKNKIDILITLLKCLFRKYNVIFYLKSHDNTHILQKQNYQFN